MKPLISAETLSSQKWYHKTRNIFHGIPSIISFCPFDEKLADKVWDSFEQIDHVFNGYKESCELYKLNANPNDITRISGDMKNAIELAIDLKKMSNGAFDITVMPLIQLWKNAAKNDILPSHDEITNSLQKVGLEKLKIEGQFLHRTVPGMSMEFGGFIKGLAVDQAIKILKEAGVSDALVQIGGETATFGLSAKTHHPHSIGIQDPLSENRLLTIIKDLGTGLSASTSGNYRQPVEIQGKKYYHIVDPSSGQPVDSKVLSVSVLFPTTGKNYLADALSTSLTILNTSLALDKIQSLGGEALIIKLGPQDEMLEFKTSNWDNYTSR